jgi:hypothetical protein
MNIRKNHFPSIKLKAELFKCLNDIGYNNIIKVGVDMYLAEKV